MGTAFLQHLSRQSSTSGIRSLGDQFLIGLIEVHERRHPQYPFFLVTTSPLRGLLRTWFESTPKTLWELGNRDPEATQRLLRFLLQMGLRGTAPLEPPFSLFEASVSVAASSRTTGLCLTMIDLPGDLGKTRTILLPESPDKRGRTRSLDQARVAGRQEARDGGGPSVDGMGREWRAGWGGGAGDDEFWWCGGVVMLACSRVSSARLWMIRERAWARRQEAVRRVRIRETDHCLAAATSRSQLPPYHAPVPYASKSRQLQFNNRCANFVVILL